MACLRSTKNTAIFFIMIVSLEMVLISNLATQTEAMGMKKLKQLQRLMKRLLPVIGAIVTRKPKKLVLPLPLPIPIPMPVKIDLDMQKKMEIITQLLGALAQKGEMGGKGGGGGGYGGGMDMGGDYGGNDMMDGGYGGGGMGGGGGGYGGGMGGGGGGGGY